jgi:flagellin
MATLDAASGLLSRLQELAVLGANDTNTAADSRAIDAEAEAIADEFHRLLSNAKYKGRDLFVTNADSELVSIGGRGAQMTFGVKKIDYSALYSTSDGSATNTIVEGRIYKVSTDNADLNPFNGGTDPGGDDSTFIASKSGTATTGRVKQLANQLTVAASEGRTTTNTLTSKIEAVQASVNTARVQAGSQYAAIESAVNYTTDLTAQYELGYNTVNDVNFSMETAHLAKNQILQQAATAMLAQANQGQQSLLQLIQG